MLRSSGLISCVLLLLTGSLTLLSLPSIAETIKPSARTAVSRAALPRGQVRDFGEAPNVPAGPLSQGTRSALRILFSDIRRLELGEREARALRTVRRSKDPRLAWIVVDAMRFVRDPVTSEGLLRALNQLLGGGLRRLDDWSAAADRLMAWDVPAPPGYLEYKRKIYTRMFPGWNPLFERGDIDWRHVSWGGVGIDDREFGNTGARCNCIPAADNPAVTSAADATWLTEDAVVFGVSVNGAHRAYPRRIMEVREMVNDTLGGRHLGIPYCTLCGSAQAWYTDQLPAGVQRPILRTSGLLIRSNKVMYDQVTKSVFDTFLGRAVTGTLGQQSLQLDAASVVTTTWSAWKDAHPDTTVLAERLALGQNFDFRNTRDANGPIFPIGNTDARLAVQEDVLGVITPAGDPIAFHVESLIAALDAGEGVNFEGVQILLEAGGVRAVDLQGRDLGTHQAFWFAWSQFHPGTKLWPE